MKQKINKKIKTIIKIFKRKIKNLNFNKIRHFPILKLIS